MYAIVLRDGSEVEERGGYDWGRAFPGTRYWSEKEAATAQDRLRCGGVVVDLDTVGDPLPE